MKYIKASYNLISNSFLNMSLLHVALNDKSKLVILVFKTEVHYLYPRLPLLYFPHGYYNLDTLKCVQCSLLVTNNSSWHIVSTKYTFFE